MTGDWRATFFEAGRHWLTPYQDSYHFVYPPWLAVILAPLGLTTVVVSRALFGVVTVALVAFAVRRLGGGLSALLMVLLTPFWVTVLVRGETDAWPLLGLALGFGTGLSTTAAALALLAIKPHTLGGAAFILFFRARRKKQLVFLLSLFAFLTLLVYGFWPLAIWQRLPALYHAGDISIWPWGIPAGVVLLWLGYRRQSLLWAAPATFFLAPYFGWYSLAGYAAIAFARLPRPVAALLLLLSWLALARLPGVFGQ